MSNMTIEQRLALNHYDVDSKAHIKVKVETCQKCDTHQCLYVCPAECFKFKEDKISFSYEGCLECGSCRISCEQKAIEWAYPRAGFGVGYEYG